MTIVNAMETNSPKKTTTTTIYNHTSTKKADAAGEGNVRVRFFPKH